MAVDLIYNYSFSNRKKIFFEGHTIESLTFRYNFGVSLGGPN